MSTKKKTTKAPVPITTAGAREQLATAYLNARKAELKKYLDSGKTFIEAIKALERQDTHSDSITLGTILLQTARNEDALTEIRNIGRDTGSYLAHVDGVLEQIQEILTGDLGNMLIELRNAGRDANNVLDGIAGGQIQLGTFLIDVNAHLEKIVAVVAPPPPPPPPDPEPEPPTPEPEPEPPPQE